MGVCMKQPQLAPGASLMDGAIAPTGTMASSVVGVNARVRSGVQPPTYIVLCRTPVGTGPRYHLQLARLCQLTGGAPCVGTSIARCFV